MSRLIVKNIPKGVTEDKIKNIFSKKGVVTDVQLKFTDAGVFRRFGFVGFEKESEAHAAVEYFNNSCINTTRITVELCKTLGNNENEKSYSKHSKAKKAEAIPEAKNGEISKKKTLETVEDIMKEHKSDPLFMEFMQSYSKDTKFWDGDVALPDNHDEKVEEMRVKDLKEGANILKQSVVKNDHTDKLKGLKSDNPKVDTDLFTVKLMNIPYKAKRSDIQKFFKPIKPFSIRIPRHGFAFAGFKTKTDFNKALTKDRSFMKEKQIQVIDYCERNKMDIEQTQQPEVKKNTRWSKQEDALLSEENINESGKIYFRNLPYTVEEKDLQEMFDSYGPLAELHLPIDSETKQIKGFGTVTYVMPEHAITAFNDLNGTSFHGRMLHLLPGKTKKEKQIDLSGLSIKERKLFKQKQNAENSFNWNSLFMGTNAVANALASNYNISKEQVLNTADGGSNAAVRLALGETEMVSKIKSYLEDHGILLDAFNQFPTKRSTLTIIAKNLPSGTSEIELKKIFAPFGLFKIILPPNGVTAVIDFVEPSEAKKAFKKLAYTKFKHVPLYLEWAPDNVFKTRKHNSDSIADGNVEDDSNSNLKSKSKINKTQSHDNDDDIINSDKNENENNEDEDEKEEEAPEDGTTIFLRNLNFETIESTVENHFKNLGSIHSVQIAQKRDPTKESGKASLGYGFVQFKKRATLEKALKTMQFTNIDGNKVELKRSDRVLKSQEQSTRKTVKITKQTGTKIMVRNIPFQAKESEIRELFKTFGELRAVRLPMKMGEEAHRGFGFVDFITNSDAKKAFNALCQSTHLYGRRLVLEWAKIDDDNVDELRKRTADHFTPGESSAKRSRKGMFETSKVKAKKIDE